jgi:hypothetical protein
MARDERKRNAGLRGAAIEAAGVTGSTVVQDGNGTEITPVCFVRDTRILTDYGEVAVETLTYYWLRVSGFAGPERT